MRGLDLFASDPWGNALVVLGLIRVGPDGQEYSPDPERLERILQGLQAYHAALHPRVKRARDVTFTFHWPFLAFCGQCGAHYRLDLPGGVERAKAHQDHLKHQPWRTEFRKPWRAPPDTVLEQAGERTATRSPTRDPGQLIVPPPQRIRS